MSFIYSIKSDVPQYKYDQYEVYELMAPHIEPRQRNIFKVLLRSTKIRQRYFSGDLEHLIQGALANNVTQKFEIWETESLNYLSKQIEQLLNESGLSADQIDGICVNSTSGVITPGLDVLLADLFNLREDIVRFPFFSYACTGGLIAMNRMSEYLRLYPNKCLIYCCTETNSPHLQLTDTMSSLMHNSIFGDGFATILMVGAEHDLAADAQVEIRDTKSMLITQGRKSLTYTMDNTGFKGQLSASLPDILKANIKKPVEELLCNNNIEKEDLRYVVTHIGGPKVIRLITEALGLPDDIISTSLETYRNYGNQGSVSILNSLMMELQGNEEQGLSMFMAMGPGISIELSHAILRPWKNSDKQASQSACQHIEHKQKTVV